MRRIALFGVGVAVAVIAGCGGGSESSSTTTTEASSSTSSTTTTSTAGDQTKDFLGASLTAATAGEPGVVVLELQPDTASRLKPGDVIVACNGEPVATPDQLIGCAGKLEIGGQFTIRVVRGSHSFTLAEVQSPTAYLGAEVKDPTGGDKGALVVSVAPKSPAAEADLQKDDLITAIDDAPVSNVKTLLQAIGPHAPGDAVTVAFTRASQALDVTATLASRPDPGAGG
jgi:S1-C subfamily serine protease